MKEYLSIFSEQIDEIVSISWQARNNTVEVFIDRINLFWDLALLEQERCFMLLGGKYNAFLCDYSWVKKEVPIEEPVLLIASTAYSICCSLPSGVKVVVLESYLLDI